MGRHSETLPIKSKDKKELERIIKRGKHSSREITRASILLFLCEGRSAEEIADIQRVTSATVYSIKNKYKKAGLKAALYDKERPGRPSIFSGEQRAKITALACSNPPEGASQWSLRLLADKAVELKYVESISYEGIREVLKKK